MGFPLSSNCSAHRLATTTWVPSRRLWINSRFPAAGAIELCADLFQRDREDRLHQMVRNLADRLVLCPAVQFFGAVVPEGDDVVIVAHEDCVVGEIQKVCPLSQNLFAPFAFRDFGLQSFSNPPQVGCPLLDSSF